jgi:16S rRNA (cytidine1402-2'-O)-methyltransferase
VLTGRLIVCATPIGNLGDISDNLREALADADVVFAEDTRRTAKLLRHLAISVEVVSLFAGNERGRTDQVVRAVESGKTVVLVSDAGMPTVSDPGASVVRAVREVGGLVSVVPGPSAVTTAVALSGFGGDRFVFEGFLPRKGQERSRRLTEIGRETRVTVLFASPKRLAADLNDLVVACGGSREVAVARELTKLHEESWVGPLADAAERFTDPVKGEVTLVLAEVEPEQPSPDEAVDRARELVADGLTVSDAARLAAEETGVSRRVVYESLISNQI